MKQLYEAVRGRQIPEDVAKAIFAEETIRGPIHGQVLPDRLLKSLGNRSRQRSFMPTSFRQAAGFEKDLQTCRELFPALEAPYDNDLRCAEQYLIAGHVELRLDANADFGSRLNRESRRAKGLQYLGHRAYNKRVRFVQRLKMKLHRRRGTTEILDLAQIAKTRLASRITYEQFVQDRCTAYFLAYMTANLGRRSLFTYGHQPRALDTAAAALLAECEQSPTTQWLLISYVHPSAQVLSHLTEEQKGVMMGQWFDVMVRASRILRRQAVTTCLDLHNMVVARGNDSSTWNEAAGAFNKARDAWITTLYSMGHDQLLDVFCPGKALRLMAADVVAMHRSYRKGGGLDPDTYVWGQLPRPWDVVLDGEILCSREMIRTACARAQFKDDRGWTGVRKQTVVPVQPTPELVHGVSVSSPELALRLRKAGYFSGKEVKEFVPIDKHLDAENATVVATEPVLSEDEEWKW